MTEPAPQNRHPADSLAGLAALASAVAGQPMMVQWGMPGRLGDTDGRRIKLDPHQAAAARTTAVIQAALVTAGSLDPAMLLRLPRFSRRVRHRYLYLEVLRAVTAHSAVLPARGWSRPGASAPTSSTEESLRFARGRRPLPAPPREWGAINARAVVAASRIAQQITDDGDRHDDNPGEKPTRRRRSRRQLRTPRRAGSRGRGVLVDVLGLRAQRRSVPAGDVSAEGGSGLNGPTVPPGTVVRRYREWDCHAARFKADWCSVIEVANDGPTDPSSPNNLGAALAGVRLDHARVRHRTDGDVIDLDAAIAARVDAVTGHTPDERIYSAQLPSRQPIGVFVLLDMSGSLGRDAGSTGAARAHRSAAMSIVEASQHLGDRVGAAAFRSFGRHRVEISRVVDFGARFDAAARDALDRLRPGGFTRMGAAVRYAGERLQDAGTRRRLLVVVTDGFPFDHGYEQDYAAADTERALDEVFASGAAIVCLAVGGAAHPELVKVFGSVGFLHLRHPNELRTRYPEAMRAALTRVENTSRRRDWP